MNFRRAGAGFLFCLAAALATISQAADGEFYIKKVIPSNGVPIGSKGMTIDYQDIFGLRNVKGTIVQMRTTIGPINMEMLPAAAPLSVTNFLKYVTDGALEFSLVHRVDEGLGIIQGGGYRIAFDLSGNVTGLEVVPTRAPIALEYNLPNVRGTVAMARTDDPNSATSQWFINQHDNTAIFNTSNGGGYAVFARVIGGGMNVVDAIGNLTEVQGNLTVSGAPDGNVSFGSLPVINYNQEQGLGFNNFIVTQPRVVPLFPTLTSNTAALTLSYIVNPPTQKVYAITFAGSKLTIKPRAKAFGAVTIALVAQDNAGASAAIQFTLVAGGPIISKQPTLTHTVKIGGNANLAVTAKSNYQMLFQWYRNGKPLHNSTHVAYSNLPKLALKNIQATQAGTYVVTITNRYGTVVSQAVSLVVK